MRRFVPVAFLAFGLFSASAIAAPGYTWEIGMEMEGMPFAMPKQKICAPRESKEPPVSREGDECKTLEKKLSGNHFHWKAQCKDGLMVGDITSTPTSYAGSMKMTDKSGETMSMKMSGKRLGECDYKDRSGEIKALVKQSEDNMAEICKKALADMQGQLMGSCPQEKKIFCQRFATPEGYDKATRHVPLESINDPTLGVASMARECKLDNAKLLPKLCASALTSSNFNFVSRLCPVERPKLCTKAMSADRVDYVGANCPAEKAVLVKQHCEGRKNSNDIEPRYATLCSDAAMSQDLAREEEAEKAAEKRKPASAEPSEASKKAEQIQQGIKQLKGLFGF